jgi:hypothetical protein
MGYPYPLPKKFLCGFARIPGVILEASEGVQTPKPPRGLATVLFIILNMGWKRKLKLIKTFRVEYCDDSQGNAGGLKFDVLRHVCCV